MSKSERRTFEIDETKAIVYARAGGQCEYIHEEYGRCPASVQEIGHFLPQDKMHIKIYGEELIHHPENLLGVCSVHNSYVELDVKTQPMAVVKHIAKLREIITEENGETD
jgi:hypothetical protein